MRTYYIFNVNRYFSYMYKNKPFKMYKMFEEIYYSKSYDSLSTYRNFETVAAPFNKIMLNEYIYYEFKLKYGYKRNGNKHNLNTSENSTLQINNYNIKLITENNYSIFFKYLNNYITFSPVCKPERLRVLFFAAY